MRYSFVVEVNLDPIPGSFHEPDETAEQLARILREMIPHYLPTVTVSGEVK